MEGTTIFLSKEFHDWIKGKGRKGESYENIIISLLKPEFLQELGNIKRTKAKVSSEPAKKPDKLKSSNAANSKALSKKKQNKPKPNNPKKSKEHQEKKLSKPKPSNAANRNGAKSRALPIIKEPKELKYKKNLELQSLKVELELAKLSNDTNKIRNLSAQIAKFNGDSK